MCRHLTKYTHRGITFMISKQGGQQSDGKTAEKRKGQWQ